MPKTEEEFIQAVSMVYNSYPQNENIHTWLTLQCCLNHITLHNRDNDSNIEHILKQKLECTGQSPDVLDVVEDAVQIFHTNTNTNDETED